MHPLVKNTIKFFLFLAVSAFLFWLVYRDQNWDELLTVLKEDVNYFWIGVACVMGIASHVSRALRWQLLTASMGYRISFGNSFMGVMIGYFANLAIPRMGEFTRCGVVSKYEEVPFSKLLGTVVTERVIDMMILLFLTLIVVITQFKQVGIFLDNNRVQPYLHVFLAFYDSTMKILHPKIALSLTQSGVQRYSNLRPTTMGVINF